MKSAFNISRVTAILLAALIYTTGIATASEDIPMKMPEDGICEASYILLDGVCIPPEALQGDPVALMEKIRTFKGDAESPDQGTDPIEEDPSCAQYREILQKYLNEGVTTLNPETGQMETTRGAAIEAAIRDIEEYLDTFCNN